ncbi:MAG: hypothetical protein ACC651_07195 [Candidatus Scalindua sp.]
MASPIYLEVIKGGFTLAAAGLGMWIALRLYFRQKEYELIKQRYLEDAVDIVAAEVEQSLGVVRHNWARCLNIVKAFRDEKSDFDIQELEKGFQELDSSKLHRVPHHRIGNLTQSQLIWQIYQHAIAFSANSNTVITKEIPDTIKLKLTSDRIVKETKKIVDSLFKTLKDIDAESHKYACLTRALHALGLMLETERLSFQGIMKLAERVEVKNLLARLKADFADELEQDEQSIA